MDRGHALDQVPGQGRGLDQDPNPGRDHGHGKDQDHGIDQNHGRGQGLDTGQTPAQNPQCIRSRCHQEGGPVWRQEGGEIATQALIGVGILRTGLGILPTPPHNGGPSLPQIDIGRLIGEDLEVLQVAGKETETETETEIEIETEKETETETVRGSTMEATNTAAVGVAEGITIVAMEPQEEGDSGGKASETMTGTVIGTGKIGITTATKTLEITIMVMHVTTSIRAIITEIINSATINTEITTSSSTNIGTTTSTQTDGNSPSRMKVRTRIEKLEEELAESD